MSTTTEIILPRMGESIIEASLISYTKQVGDFVQAEDIIAEVATDKVDNEIPSPISGTITALLFNKEDVITVGQPIAIIQAQTEPNSSAFDVVEQPQITNQETTLRDLKISETDDNNHLSVSPLRLSRRYSPLVKSICAKEGIDSSELEQITGSGTKGRVTKKDLSVYLRLRKDATNASVKTPSSITNHQAETDHQVALSPKNGDQIIEMTRMRKLIAKNMVASKHISPHATLFQEVDVTNLANWRKQHKTAFQQRNGAKLTFTPLFLEAIIKSVKDFPRINVSLKGDLITIKQAINIGMATALPDGNLIVPVIKAADKLNLSGLAIQVNGLANKARAGKLTASDIQDGTFTVSNVGTFGTDAGTPIINQPQAAILAYGAIKKKPAVVETEFGDLIAIRQLMMLSLSIDHRIIDGSLGGQFLNSIKENLENFNPNRTL